MTDKQRAALRVLSQALKDASDAVGEGGYSALDLVQNNAASPDSINDVVDAVAETLDPE